MAEDAAKEKAPEGSSGVDRRRFLKLALMSGAGLAAAAAVAKFATASEAGWDQEAPPEAGRRGRDWVMVIDLEKCDGCKECTYACQKTHSLPEGQEWIKVYSVEGENGSSYFLPRPCMQCEKAPCTSVCPVAATFTRDDGIVIIDADKCIGCRYCMAACPYNARYFNWGGTPELTPEQRAIYDPEMPVVHRRGTTAKCVFCAKWAREGKLPACSSGCPMGAIYFGDRGEDAVTNRDGETLRLSKLLRERSAFRWKEELGTEPRVFYLPPKGGSGGG